MTGLGCAAVVVFTPLADADVAGLAAAALFVFVVAVASAAFFLVGIVAFRSVGAAAFGAVVLEGFEIAAGFGAGLAAVGTVLVRVLAGVGFDAVTLRGAAGAEAELALPTVGFFAATLSAAFLSAAFSGAWPTAALALPTFGAEARAFVVLGLFAAVRARAAAAGFAARAVVVARVALARFTEAGGWAAVRAAALDAAAGLAVRAVDFAAAFVPEAPRAFAGVDLVRVDLAVAAFGLAAPCLAAACFAEPDLAAAGALAERGFRAAVSAALRPRATGLVLGDMSATPGIGRPPEAQSVLCAAEGTCRSRRSCDAV